MRHSGPRRSIRNAIAPGSAPGDPLPFDSHVKDWPFWKQTRPRRDDLADPMPVLLASAGHSKDTTHMSVIDKDGNMFDTTSSGGWITGA
jgi:gamma-glutamyltranspeptidase/glutathione hydrolase